MKLPKGLLGLRRKKSLNGGGKKLRVFKRYFVELMKLFLEITLFILNLPLYLKQFLKGLRIFRESYEGIVRELEEKQKILKNTIGEMTAEATTYLINEIIRLKNELEKMFNQLFSIFIATLALIISICALIINIRR